MSARQLTLAAAGFCVAWAGGWCLAGEPRIDGVPNEWVVADQLAPAAGGSSGVFNVSSVSARSAGSVLFLRFNTGIVRNLQAGTGSDGTLILDIRRTQPTEESVLTVDLRARSLWENGNPGSTISWLVTGFEVLPTFAATEYELRVDLASVGLGQGDQVAITFGDGGSGENAATFTLSDAASALAVRSHDRPALTRLRVASINTKSTGLFGGQQSKFRRLIDSMNADVYCFQEEYNSSAGQIDSLIQSIDPREDGVGWNVHKNNDNVVASPHPLVPLPSLSSKYAGAVVDLGGGEGVIVFSIHPKCCGYIGSSEDNQRIGEMQDLIDALTQVRDGSAGSPLLPFQNAPVMVIGDWNLVGSRVPLDMLEDPAGPDMRDTFVPPLIPGSYATWHGSSTGPGSFMPGRLDLLAVQRGVLTVMNAFTLDTGLLDASDLSALGLQAGDSAATDHLMLVVDLAFPGDLGAGDVDGSGQVDVLDFGDLAPNFGFGPGATRSEGDLSGDGFVDVFDFSELAGQFGATCP